MEQSKRIIWLDIVKVFATFLIVMQHSIANEWAKDVEDAVNFRIVAGSWSTINLFFIIVRAGVPLFFLCSGYGMFQRRHGIKEIYTSSVRRILVPYFCWMLIFGCMEAVKSSTVKIGIGEIIKALVFGRYHTWFIATLLGLYIVTPFIQEFIYDRQLLKYFIIVSLAFTIIIPLFGLIGDDRLTHIFNDFNMNFVVGYVLYYILGYFIGGLENGRIQLIIAALMTVVALAICQIICIKDLMVKGPEVQNYYSAFSVLGFIIPVSLFYIFKCIFADMGKERVAGAVSGLAKLGMGIYLVHPLLLPLIKEMHGYRIFLGGTRIPDLCRYQFFDQHYTTKENNVIKAIDFKELPHFVTALFLVYNNT